MAFASRAISFFTEKEAARPTVECDSLTHMMAHIYPYTWEPLSEEDDATVKQCYGHLGHCRELVRCQESFSFTTARLLNTIFFRSKPELMRATPGFQNHCEKVRNIKVRLNLSRIVTEFHQRCDLTMFGLSPIQNVAPRGLRCSSTFQYRQKLDVKCKPGDDMAHHEWGETGGN